MDLTRDTLPDDPEKLKAMIAELLSARTAFEAEVATLQAANLDKQARIDRLQLLLKTIQRATYGRSSEKLDESQYAFAFEEVQTALGEIEVQLDRLEPKNKQKPGGRRPLPAPWNVLKRLSSQKKLSALVVHARASRLARMSASD